jgi:hypothetical protein
MGPEDAETAGRAIEAKKATMTKLVKNKWSGFHPLPFVGLVRVTLCPSQPLLSIFAFACLHFIILHPELMILGVGP